MAAPGQGNQNARFCRFFHFSHFGRATNFLPQVDRLGADIHAPWRSSRKRSETRKKTPKKETRGGRRDGAGRKKGSSSSSDVRESRREWAATLALSVQTPVGKRKVAKPRTSAEKAARTKRTTYVRNCMKVVRPLRKLPIPSTPVASQIVSTATGSRKEKIMNDSAGHPHRILQALGDEGLDDVKQWIRLNFRAKGKKNLTAKMLGVYLSPKCGWAVHHKDARSLLHFLGYKYKKLKNGYYVRRMLDEDVVQHRDLVIVLTEMYYTYPHLFRLVSMDETGVRCLRYEGYGWCLETEVMDQYDERTASGPGVGLNLVTYMEQSGIMWRRDENDPGLLHLVGNVLESNKEGGKVNAAVFLNSVKQCFDAADTNRAGGYSLFAETADSSEKFDLNAELVRIGKRKVPEGGVRPEREMIDYEVDDRITALYADGAAFHRTFLSQEGSFNPAASSMNWKKTSDKKPVSLHQKLQELGLLHLMPESMPSGGWAAPARKILFESAEFRGRKIAAEEISEEYQAAVYQLGPCAMPCLNPKENFYRWLKGKLSEFNGMTMDELREHVQELVTSFDVPPLAERWFRRAQGFRWFFYDNLGSGKVPPTDFQMDQMMANGTVTGHAIAEAVETLLKKISKDGSIPRVPGNIDMSKLRKIQHAQNFMRYRATRRKKGTADADEASEESEDE